MPFSIWLRFSVIAPFSRQSLSLAFFNLPQHLNSVYQVPIHSYPDEDSLEGFSEGRRVLP